MKYSYHDLSPRQFEKLVLLLCQEFFGLAASLFSEGPDGGCDIRFTGTANCYPSSSQPWTGITVIQVKHTNGLNKSYSEKDFFNADRANTVIGKEIPKIRELRSQNKLDNYMLFSNRRLTAKKDTEIRQFVSSQCDISISSVALCGIENFEIYLKKFPRIAEEAEIDPVDSPLTISPELLSEIIEALADRINSDKTIKEKLLQTFPVNRVTLKDKNLLNNMTENYIQEQIKKHLEYTPVIQKFLAEPENGVLRAKYESAAEEMQFKIVAHRRDYQTFDEVMEYIFDQLFAQDPVLKMHRPLTRKVLFYMYWNCDIGQDDNAKTN